MAKYHLLQSKEHNDEEEEETGYATPSPAGTESKLWKHISIFLAVCIIAITSFIAGRRFNSHLSSNSAAFTEDLSFLSRYIPIATTVYVKSQLMETLPPPLPSI